MFADDSQIDLLMRTLLLGPMMLVWALVVVRISGLRALSKMTAIDFVVTVALGTLLGNVASASSWPDALQPAGAFAMLLMFQALHARLRRASPFVKRLTENRPVVLMRDGRFDEAAMAGARVHADDVWAKLRESNTLSSGAARYVVLETTGDISVLHGDGVDDRVLTGVARKDG